MKPHLRLRAAFAILNRKGKSTNWLPDPINSDPIEPEPEGPTGAANPEEPKSTGKHPTPAKTEPCPSGQGHTQHRAINEPRPTARVRPPQTHPQTETPRAASTEPCPSGQGHTGEFARAAIAEQRPMPETPSGFVSQQPLAPILNGNSAEPEGLVLSAQVERKAWENNPSAARPQRRSYHVGADALGGCDPQRPHRGRRPHHSHHRNVQRPIVNPGNPARAGTHRPNRAHRSRNRSHRSPIRAHRSRNYHLLPRRPQHCARRNAFSHEPRAKPNPSADSTITLSCAANPASTIANSTPNSRPPTNRNRPPKNSPSCASPRSSGPSAASTASKPPSGNPPSKTSAPSIPTCR